MDKKLIPYVKINYKAECWVMRKGVMWLDRGTIKDVTHAGIVISLSSSENRNKKPEMYKGDFLIKWHHVYKIVDKENKIIMELKRI